MHLYEKGVFTPAIHWVHFVGGLTHAVVVEVEELLGLTHFIQIGTEKPVSMMEGSE